MTFLFFKTINFVDAFPSKLLRVFLIFYIFVDALPSKLMRVFIIFYIFVDALTFKLLRVFLIFHIFVDALPFTVHLSKLSPPALKMRPLGRVFVFFVVDALIH